MIINETHERYEGLISLPGYVWFGAKRIKRHMKSVRAFGGVGMFVKEHIMFWKLRFHDFIVLQANVIGIISILRVLYCILHCVTKIFSGLPFLYH